MLNKKDNGAPTGGGQTLNTIIGRGTVFEGTMKVENSVRIDGVFKGELTCSGALTISQAGEAYANLEAKDVYLNGIVRGTIHAERVRLDSQARFVGDVHASSLSVTEGAILHGQCCMDEDGVRLHPANGEGHAEGTNGSQSALGRAAEPASQVAAN